MPGHYLASEQSCYWARLSGLGGELSEIVANDNAEGRIIVEVKAADAAFQSSGCGIWNPFDVGAAVSQQSSFGDGSVVVGRDIAPGLYAASRVPGDSCYWERQSGLGGEPADIIDNDFVFDDGAVVVTIANGDFSFTSSGCGTWTKS